MRIHDDAGNAHKCDFALLPKCADRARLDAELPGDFFARDKQRRR